MHKDDLRAVMVRDLRALAREVSLYPSDDALWRTMPGIANSGGTLALHLAGNVQHFIGAVLGGSGYVRDREAEFASRGIARATVVAEVERAISALEQALDAMPAARMAEPFPIEMGGKRLVTSRMLTHLAVHLTYHLGQIDYHRRMVAPESGVAGAVAVTEL